MAKRDRFTPVFQQMIDEPEASLEALRTNAAAFERAVVAAEGQAHFAQAAIPNRSALAFILFGQRGHRLPADIPDWLPPCESFDELLLFVDPRSRDGRLICIPVAGEAPLFGLWAPFAETENWNLPLSLRETGERNGAAWVAIFAGGGRQPIEEAVAAFGLPALQQRVVGAVVRLGSLRAAADALGISYNTAREAMSDAAGRMHLPNMPAVVRTVVWAAFGVLPGDVDAAVQLADMLAISDRQARIALLISGGASREETARAIGTSAAVIKKELQLLYATFGLQSAAEFARLIAEIHALRLFARSVDNAPGFLDPAIEPSRFSMRPNGRGMIAWSDYGPASGRPVLIVHSNWCCRAVPRPLVEELQARKWRPIAIDRPGFGATHVGGASREDPFSQAIADAIQLLDALNIDRIPIIARCGAQFVHAFKTASPDRVGPVVLVAPTPQADANGKRMGVVGAFKEAFYRSPRLVELFFRVISAQFTFERVEHLMRSITKGSPVDEALCEDPRFIRDRFRALRPFTCGNYIGGIFEELVISHGGWCFDPLQVDDWAVLQGSDDPHNDFDEVRRYWEQLLPGGSVENIQGGGRFMTSSHPGLVVDRLEAMQRPRLN
ncbi:MAG: alpha/beta fold hydrolase [Sphingomonadales bacterium]|nr:alpha/beta fold hydrolase [Sphingomonadales bacterium]